MRRIGDSPYAALLSIALAFGGLAIANSPGTAATIRVPADQPTIQAGIDAANNGDEVLVAPGVYTGTGNKNLDLHQKDIVVRAEFGAEATIIDCEGSGRGFGLFGAYPTSTRIEGFMIQNGNGNGELLGGGGMIIEGGAPTINSCIFTGNTASGSGGSGGGGGLVCHNSSALIEDCEFDQNSVEPSGGAVGGGLASRGGTPTIRACRFNENTALSGGGGGIYVHFIAPTPAVVIERCEFVGNKGGDGGAGVVTGSHVLHCTIDANEGHPGVGGIVLSSSVMESCLFTDNSSEQFGGGVQALNSTMTDCLVARNRAVRGGGIWASNGSTIERCVVFDNQADVGGGLYCSEKPSSSFIRCTVVRNRAQEGSGVAVSSNQPIVHHMEGSIVAQGIGGSAIACLGAATMDVTCTNLFGTQGGDWVGCVEDQEGKAGNFSADPLFCAPAANNFTLDGNSPCLPGNHPAGANCGVIGAEDKGCSTVSVEATTWGRIKARSWSSGR